MYEQPLSSIFFCLATVIMQNWGSISFTPHHFRTYAIWLDSLAYAAPFPIGHAWNGVGMVLEAGGRLVSTLFFDNLFLVTFELW